LNESKVRELKSISTKLRGCNLYFSQKLIFESVGWLQLTTWRLIKLLMRWVLV